MTATYEAIATTTLGSAQASVTFSSISGSYTDLVLVIAGDLTSGYNSVGLQFNSDTGSNYSRTVLYGDGSSAASIRSSNSSYIFAAALGSGIGNCIFNIMNYSNSTTNKTVVARSSSAGAQVRAGVGLWRSTAAITTIKAEADSTTFTSGSTFTLYGIKSE